MTLSGLSLAWITCLGVWGVGEPAVRVVSSPPVDGSKTNAFYVSNRPPLAPSPLVKLPIGAITPQGWLRHTLELEAEGTVGRLPELSRSCVREGNAWASPQGQEYDSWETPPYWLKGFGDLGYVLRDERIIGEARQWIAAVLSSQEEDGWFGPRSNKAASGGPDMWPNMLMLNTLQSYYEATGDERVLRFMLNYGRWQLKVPADRFLVPFWAKMRAGDNLETVLWLHNRTGETWLLDLARKIHEHAADWTHDIPSWHGVNICQAFREPATFGMLTREEGFLRATERVYQTVMGSYGQVPGGMFGADETARPGYGDPRQGAETCSIVEFMHSFELLTRITGNPLWADRCEEVAFNSFPAARTADLKGLHYFTAPNMIQLDRGGKTPGFETVGSHLSFDPWRYRCCQHNVSHGWPYYAEELWLATSDNGLCASLYAASKVQAKVGDGATVTLVEATDYPFGETVRFTLSAPGPVDLPLYLRIPRWCKGAAVEVNGQPIPTQAPPLSYLVIQRRWADGDAVLLHLPACVSVTVWKSNKDSVSVSRGPLNFSLKIGERWERHATPDTGRWPAYSVYATTPWNYALALDPAEPAGSFEVVTKPGPVASQPFTPEDAPIQLRIKARRVPEWKQDELGLAGTLPQSPVRSVGRPEIVTLIPMGCARLRISSFPALAVDVERKPEAKSHRLITSTRRVSASRLEDDATDLALYDQLEPKASNDRSVPLFTWSPRWPFINGRGAAEWVQYDFNTAQRVSAVEVYWFDDTPVQGGYRVPRSWRLLYRAGPQWKPVPNASPYEVAKDKYNRVTFDAVVTTGLRLEAELQGDSGGILEWAVLRAAP